MDKDKLSKLEEVFQTQSSNAEAIKVLKKELDLKEERNEVQGMTREKGDLLFKLKWILGSKYQTPEFEEFFIKAIIASVLTDDETPREIDREEAGWLRKKVLFIGPEDKCIKKLLDRLKKESINFPGELQFKPKWLRSFENGLYCSRYLSLISVLISILSALVLFLYGFAVAFMAVYKFIRPVTKNSCAGTGDLWLKDFESLLAHGSENLLADLVSSVDIFLFAMVLIIFAIGIYVLFIGKIDSVERRGGAMPSWLQVSCIDDLKSSLSKVIMMVLVVNFFKFTLKIQYTGSEDLLRLAIGILLVAGALFLVHRHHGNSHDTK